MIEKKPKQRKPAASEPTDKELSLVPQAARSALPAKVDGLYGLDVVVADFGGPRAFVKACRLSGNEKVAELVRRWEVAPKDGEFSFQAECKMLEITPQDVLADVVVALYNYHGSLAKMVNAVSVVDVMKASVESAMSPFGYQDRALQFKVAGLVKSGPLVNINLPSAAYSPEKLIHEMEADSSIEMEGPDPQKEGNCEREDDFRCTVPK